MADIATIVKDHFEIGFPNGLSDHAEIYYGTAVHWEEIDWFNGYIKNPTRLS